MNPAINLLKTKLDDFQKELVFSQSTRLDSITKQDAVRFRNYSKQFSEYVEMLVPKIDEKPDLEKENKYLRKRVSKLEKLVKPSHKEVGDE